MERCVFFSTCDNKIHVRYFSINLSVYLTCHGLKKLLILRKTIIKYIHYLFDRKLKMGIHCCYRTCSSDSRYTHRKYIPVFFRNHSAPWDRYDCSNHSKRTTVSPKKNTCNHVQGHCTFWMVTAIEWSVTGFRMFQKNTRCEI